MTTLQNICLAALLCGLFYILVISDKKKEEVQYTIPAGETISLKDNGDFSTKVDTTNDGVSDVTVTISKEIASEYHVIPTSKTITAVPIRMDNLQLTWLYRLQLQYAQGTRPYKKAL